MIITTFALTSHPYTPSFRKGNFGRESHLKATLKHGDVYCGLTCNSPPSSLPSFRRAALYCHFTFWRQASRKKSATWHAGLSNNFTAIWIYYPNRWQKCQKSLWVEGIGRTPGGEPNRCNKAIFCLPWRPWRRHKKLGILLLLFKVGTTNSQRKKPWINLSTFFNFFLKRCF